MRMSLLEKGPVLDPPAMGRLLQGVADAVAAWPGVTAALHRDLNDPTRADGTDFHYGDVGDPATELGHLHLNGDIHLAVTLPLRRALVAAKLARPMAWYDDWVVSRVGDASSVERAIWLYRLGYDRLRGVAERALLARIADRTEGRA